MIRTFGEVTDTAPEGFLPRRIHFKTLVRLNEGTKEGMMSRTIVGDGFSPRDLPVSIAAQFQTSEGHDGAVLAGRIDKLAIEDNNAEGWGWLIDDADGRRAMAAVATHSMDGNSVDLADVKVKIDFHMDDMEAPIDVIFTESRMAATTLVMTPAFPTAKAEIEAALTAAFEVEGDLEVEAPFEVNVPPIGGLTAAGRIELPHDAFTVPEPDEHQTITVSADGKRVWGHLGRYDRPHMGFLDRIVTIPRSKTNYGSYCKSPFPTDKGRVFTGPIILLGGHDATREAINKAMADVANAWADVVVVDGKIGPWMCGVVRPGVTDAALHAAMGSRVSGHWLNGELYAVCSVSAEGFPVDRATQYAVETNEENEVEYLAASLPIPERERKIILTPSETTNSTSGTIVITNGVSATGLTPAVTDEDWDEVYALVDEALEDLDGDDKGEC